MLGCSAVPSVCEGITSENYPVDLWTLSGMEKDLFVPNVFSHVDSTRLI